MLLDLPEVGDFIHCLLGAALVLLTGEPFFDVGDGEGTVDGKRFGDDGEQHEA